MKRIVTITGAILLTGFVLIGVNSLRNMDIKVQLREVKIKDTTVELRNLNEQYDELLQNNQADQKKIEKLREEKRKLEADLQAKKAEKARIAAKKAEAERVAKLQPKVAQASSVSVSGTCEQWIANAGISDVGNARELIRRESGCNPNAINRSSGACGVAQELPCGKSGCSLGDGACQVRWMNSYVASRYGSWANAVAFHNAHDWY